MDGRTVDVPKLNIGGHPQTPRLPVAPGLPSPSLFFLVLNVLPESQLRRPNGPWQRSPLLEGCRPPVKEAHPLLPYRKGLPSPETRQEGGTSTGGTPPERERKDFGREGDPRHKLQSRGMLHLCHRLRPLRVRKVCVNYSKLLVILIINRSDRGSPASQTEIILV